MADLILTPTPALAGFDRRIGTAQVQTLTELTLTSLAIPLGGMDNATAALTRETGLVLPAPGLSVTNDGTRAIRLAPDQLLLVTPGAAPAALTGPFYTTNQTDAWVTLELSGDSTEAVLARLSMLDIAAFPVDGAHRSLMAHLSVLLIRVTAGRWWLMSASSSAKSFADSIVLAMDAAA